MICNTCGNQNRDTSKFCNNCGGSLQNSLPNSTLTSGIILENRYKIIDLIKSGGMGAVYKAVDEKLDRILAVKELIPPYGAQQQQSQVTEWFKREAKILAKLDHPNLPIVLDYFFSGGRYYLLMNFIDGEDLETKLQKEGKPGLSEEEVIELAKQILYILDYLHSLNPP
ncbi:MAG: protein kinase family protein, partial [Candidatus Eremiobacterota bacterium]